MKLYHAVGNEVWVDTKKDTRELFLTVHNTINNPVPMDMQALAVANILNFAWTGLQDHLQKHTGEIDGIQRERQSS